MTVRPFKTLLVANRGEIALRVMRTARRLDYRCVAVYSEADRDAPHCRAADLALPIGAAAPAASYLNIAAILDAARRSGADAVHPGYGFLAENADFAQACEDAGLVFVGPSAAAIRAMGHKAGAKRLMEDAQVPCVPGYQGEDASDERLTLEAGRIGFPVMIKAVAGGGGRGMRMVTRAEDLAAALRSARSEAQGAFGNSDLIVEKAIVGPRHIEIQVFADAFGQVVHLGERDCSVQRRHQKLIEESPSPAVDADLRERMGRTAVEAARAIQYRGAGTLEFLLDSEGRFYFMEMNTRLQVEHAVTESLARIDLVEWQLAVASGQPLPLSQAEIDARLASGGHAIEVRLCAEDPAQDFMPQSGRVALWHAPDRVRCDHALASGLVVVPDYDSMLAKIVAHGADREQALRRLATALDDCVLLGIPSNRAFLARCIADEDFAVGRATTAFIEQRMPAAGRTAPSLTPRMRAVGALVLAWRQGASAPARYPEELTGWSNSLGLWQPGRFVLDGQACRMPLRAHGPGQFLLRADEDSALDERLYRVTRLADDQLELLVGAEVCRVVVAPHATGCHFVLDGQEHEACMPPASGQSGASDGRAGGRITAPFNGRVIAVEVRAGDAVRAGQTVAVVEAMKIEHAIQATGSGVVREVCVQPGTQVAPGKLLLELELAA
ncbi:MAG: ATP-grasp domain-containing protein [Burkholderiaceae bacterium]|nr:ATP-grasp domain-containing protein [Burkholderiaceae bacterium]